MSDGSKFFWWERLDGVPNGKPGDKHALTWQERVVLMEYMRAASGDLSSIFIGPTTIGRRLGVDARQVRRVRDRLTEKGWLILEERGGMRDGRKLANLYRLGYGPTPGTEYPPGNGTQTTGSESPASQGSEYPPTSTYTSTSSPLGFRHEKRVEELESVDFETGEVTSTPVEDLDARLDAAWNDAEALIVVGQELPDGHPRKQSARDRYRELTARPVAAEPVTDDFTADMLRRVREFTSR